MRLAHIVAAVSLLIAPLATSMAQALEIKETISPGGIKAWLVEDHAVPVVALEFAFDGGITADAPGKEGTGYLFSTLLDEGAGPYDGPAFQAELQRRGISMASDVGKGQYQISMKTTRAQLPKAFDMLRLALQETRLDAASIERLQGSIEASIRRDAERAGTLAFRQLSEQIFGDHVYGRSNKGDINAIAGITREDLIAWRDARFARDNLTVTAAGDITADELGKWLDKSLGGLPATASSLDLTKPDVDFDGKIRVMRRDIPQSNIAFALPGIPRDDPDYFTAYIINHVLGGSSLRSRLGVEIRVKRGLTYGIGSYMITRENMGLWAGNVSTRNESAGEVIDLLRAELQKVADKGITADELEAAKLNVKGAYVMGLRNSSGLAGAAMGISLADLGADYPQRREGYIDAISMDDIKRVAKRLYDPANLTITIVGDPNIKGDEELADIL